MQSLQLILIEDDPNVVSGLGAVLPSGWQLNHLKNVNALPSIQLDAAFVDMHLSDDKGKTEGLEAMKAIKESHPHAEIVAISGDLDRELMEKALKAGASRFLAKPLNADEVALTLEKIEAYKLLSQFNSQSQKKVWVGESESSKDILKSIALAKGETGTILIQGETGTGKEVAATLIHQQEDSPRPFVRVNVSSIPESLFETELFGHVKGAFTGAAGHRIGYAEAAQNGDLFLDEIEALALPLQPKLLRFLENSEIYKVGSHKPLKLNVRVIVAANEDLNKKVERNEFREDLYWRLNRHKITLPALRERPKDIEPLAKYFLSQDKRRYKTFDPAALQTLRNYSWPGNVRELKRVCEQLLLVSPLPVIRAEDIRRLISSHPQNEIDSSRGLDELVREFESQILTENLGYFKKIEDVTKNLKISKSTLYRKIKEFGIDWRE